MANLPALQLTIGMADRVVHGRQAGSRRLPRVLAQRTSEASSPLGYRRKGYARLGVMDHLGLKLDKLTGEVSEGGGFTARRPCSVLFWSIYDVASLSEQATSALFDPADTVWAIPGPGALAAVGVAQLAAHRGGPCREGKPGFVASMP